MGSFIASRFKSFTQHLKHVALSLAMVLALATAGLFSADAEASKRLGSGGSSGKQSSIATQKQATPPQAAPGQAAAPAGAQAAAQSQRSKWLGPIAGLAAGLGLAALASHFGFGEELANFMMIALLVMAVLFIIRMVMARRQSANQASSASGQPAWAAAGAGSNASSQQGFSQTQQGQQQNSLFSQQAASQQPAQSGGLFGSMNQPTAASAAQTSSQPWGVPADFDVPGFVENAKHYFRRLQAANDAGNLDDLREFTSPQLFAEFAAEIRTRQGENYTEVVRLDAELLGIETQDGEYLASVRFSGLIREGRNMPPQSFDEVWNLSKPLQGSAGWILSGIQQMGTSH